MKRGSAEVKKHFSSYILIGYLEPIMLGFLLPLASKIITDAVAKIPENEELGEKLIDICLVILGKAVKLTKTDMDDKLLETVAAAIKNREE